MTSETRRIYCCACNRKVRARLTTGSEVYPRRKDLSALPFWKCDRCGNHVGCHHKTATPTKPLGVIPTPEITNARKHIHAILDPIWKSGRIERKKLYRMIGNRLGKEYHTAEIRTIDEARKVYALIRQCDAELSRRP